MKSRAFNRESPLQNHDGAGISRTKPFVRVGVQLEVVVLITTGALDGVRFAARGSRLGITCGTDTNGSTDRTAKAPAAWARQHESRVALFTRGCSMLLARLGRNAVLALAFVPKTGARIDGAHQMKARVAREAAFVIMLCTRVRRHVSPVGTRTGIWFTGLAPTGASKMKKVHTARAFHIALGGTLAPNVRKSIWANAGRRPSR